MKRARLTLEGKLCKLQRRVERLPAVCEMNADEYLSGREQTAWDEIKGIKELRLSSLKMDSVMSLKVDTDYKTQLTRF